jgi:hypothetical protein
MLYAVQFSLLMIVALVVTLVAVDLLERLGRGYPIYDATDISCQLLLSKLNDPGEITRCETT